MQQAIDFLEESRVLQDALLDADSAMLSLVTQFKGWTIEDVIGHLLFWNRAAHLSLVAPEEFDEFFEPLMAHLETGGTLKGFERGALGEVKGQLLVEQWSQQFELTAAAFADADPSMRLKWAGPGMSARSSISARQMETWAHGQAVFDALGLQRRESDRIRNIVVLGVNTYGWSFAVRGEQTPGPTPAVVVTAPSGEQWHYGEAQADSRVMGSALEFAQVVTQTRNIADTSLEVSGEAATLWMKNAQCFAGGPNPPPEKGTRFRTTVAVPS